MAAFALSLAVEAGCGGQTLPDPTGGGGTTSGGAGKGSSGGASGGAASGGSTVGGGGGVSGSGGVGGGSGGTTQPEGCAGGAGVACSAGATPYVCSPGVSPDQLDPSLVCADEGVVNGGEAFCCDYVSGAGSSSGSGSSSGGIPAGCALDAALACTGGAAGFSCAPGDNPANAGTGLACTQPVSDASGNDTYCCFPWAYGATPCVPDDYLAEVCPDPGTYGFLCTAGDDPTSLDVQLNCSAGVPSPDGIHDEFCCLN